MTNGCGPEISHGGGCGFQAGGATGVVKLVTTPGNGVNPDGLAMPLLNGLNDAPAGFGMNSGCVMKGSVAGLRTGKNSLSDAGSAEAGLGAIICRKRSMAASCSVSGLVVVWTKGWRKASQPELPLGFSDNPPFRWPPNNWPKLRAMSVVRSPPDSSESIRS